MEFRCDPKVLAAYLSPLGRIPPTKHEKEVLTSFVFTVDSGTVTVRAANDVPMRAQVNLPATGLIDGQYAINASRLVRLLPTLTDESEIVIRADGERVEVRWGRFSCHPIEEAMAVAKFPRVPEVKGYQAVVVPANDLRAALQSVSFARGVDSTKPLFTGVSLTLAEGGAIRTAATNTIRVAGYVAPIDYHGEPIARVLRPEFVDLVLGALASLPSASEVTLYVGETDILADIDALRVSAPVIVGQYPDFSAFLPSEYPTRVAMPAGDFDKVTKRVLQGAKESGVTMSVRSDRVIFGRPGVRGMHDEVAGVSVTGPEVDVAFDTKQLAGGLTPLGTRQLAIEIIDGDQPIRLSGTTPSGGEYSFYLFPLQV